MAMTLFEHNCQAYYAALEMMSDTGKAAIVHPTGTGKSFIGFKLCEDNPDKTICWLSPSEYIFKTQIENWLSAGGDELKNIKFFTYAKLMGMTVEEILTIKPDYIVLDEFHRAGAELWGEGVNRLIGVFSAIPVLGLSATAIRYLDNQRNMVDEIFDGNVASEMTLGEAIVRGILKAPTYVLSVYSYKNDLKKYQKRVRLAKSKAVRDEAQKYLDALRRALDKADGLDEVFSKYITQKNGKYIVFCSDYDHLKQMREKVGVWFYKIDSEPHVYSAYSNDPETSKAFKAFKADESEHLKLLFCIDMLNEGVHVEKIDGVILFRPTISPIIYKQQIGRALSASKDKDPIIFDVVNNIENLYSIGTIEQEMKVAISYYRSLGLERNIVTERFKIYDDLQNVRSIFDTLNETLTASWDLMYSCAKTYYEEHGNLEVERRYKTKEGYSLGQWIFTQRKVYKGEQNGTLGEDRIRKLEAIGMVWGGVRDLSWERYYAEAKKYYEEHGDLNVPANYVTDSGIRLGAWISNLRTSRNCRIRVKSLSDDRIKALDKIGMIWNQVDWMWDKYFAAAQEYFFKHGNLDIGNRYVTEDGLRLGNWITRNRLLYHGTAPGSELTAEKIAKLTSIGMIWDKKYALAWENGFIHAQEYFRKNGHLKVSLLYVSPDGYRLGQWVANQRDNKDKISDERKAKLDSIGMIWEKPDPWEVRYALAKAYYEEHGNLQIPLDYKPEGIWLNKWVNDQKQIYRGKRKGQKLTDDQIKRLEEIGMVWENEKALKAFAAWNAQYAEAEKFFKENGHLNVPTGYRSSKGKNLSAWIILQRKYYKLGKLTEEQIEKLNAIGMVWEFEDAWEVGFEHAKRYFDENGNLLVTKKYVCTDGYRLGQWIVNQRNNYNNSKKYGRLTENQIQRLEAIGMQWRVSDIKWEEHFFSAKSFFDKHGNLLIPREYRVDGFNLFYWIVEQRRSRRKGDLSEDKIKKLNSIGMDWGDSDGGEELAVALAKGKRIAV